MVRAPQSASTAWPRGKVSPWAMVRTRKHRRPALSGMVRGPRLTVPRRWGSAPWRPLQMAWLSAITASPARRTPPLFAWLWTTLGSRGLEPSAPAKFGLGIIQLGAGFLVLVAGAGAVASGNPTPGLFLSLTHQLPQQGGAA